MRIVRARTQLVRWPIAPDGAARDRRERTALLLEIVTADGHVGLGEAAPLPGMSVDTLEDAEAALTSFVSRVPFELAPVLEELAISASGRIVSLAPEAAPSLVDDMSAAPVATSTERTPTTPMEVARAGDTARHRARRESTRHAGGGAARGVLDDVVAHSASTSSPSARFAIETALLAAAAREMGMPLATLLVPRPATSLPCATVVDDPAAARRAVLAGVRTLKIKVGPSGDIERVIAIHRAAPDAMLRLDANRSWPRDRVASILRALAELPIEFVEEPSANTLALLSEAVPVPLALDESLAVLSPEHVVRALASRSLGAIVVKPTLVGGLHAATLLAAKAREAGKRVVISHALEGPIGTAACAALAVAIGERDTAVGLAPHSALASWPIGLPHLTPAMLHAALEPGLGLDRLTRLASRLDAPTRLVDLAGHLERALERAGMPNDIALITPSRSVRFDEPESAGIALPSAGSRTTRVLVAAPTLDTARSLRAALASRTPVALLHPRLGTDELARQRAAVDAVAVEDGAVVLFTSGSTGTPRGVVHTRASIDAAVAASEQHLGWRTGDRWLLALPMAHTGGLAVLARCDAARVPVVLLEGDFDRARCAALLEDCTIVSLVPTQLAALLDDPNWRPPAKLRAVLLGGAAAPAALLEAAASRGVPFLTSYGLTETFGQIATAPLGHAGDPRAPLVPLPGVVIRGGTRAQPAPLVVETRQLAARYLDGAPIAPRFTTSDLGFVEDGRVHVVGRADDVIITGGENVHPSEIEALLLATPGVRAACAFGVPDARWGQIVAAVIVVDATFDEGRALARWELLPAHAQPRELAIAAALPLSPNAKIDRRAAAAIPRRALRSRA